MSEFVNIPFNLIASARKKKFISKTAIFTHALIRIWYYCGKRSMSTLPDTNGDLFRLRIILVSTNVS